MFFFFIALRLELAYAGTSRHQRKPSFTIKAREIDRRVNRKFSVFLSILEVFFVLTCLPAGRRQKIFAWNPASFGSFLIKKRPRGVSSGAFFCRAAMVSSAEGGGRVRQKTE